MGGSGQLFKYQVTTAQLAATVTTLDTAQTPQNYTTGDRLLIGVGNVGRLPNQATYTLYNSNSDQVILRTVHYRRAAGFG